MEKQRNVRGDIDGRTLRCEMCSTGTQTCPPTGVGITGDVVCVLFPDGYMDAQSAVLAVPDHSNQPEIYLFIYTVEN